MISRTHGGRKSEFVTLKDPSQNAHFQLFYFIHNDMLSVFHFTLFAGTLQCSLAACCSLLQLRPPFRPGRY